MALLLRTLAPVVPTSHLAWPTAEKRKNILALVIKIPVLLSLQKGTETVITTVTTLMHGPHLVMEPKLVIHGVKLNNEARVESHKTDPGTRDKGGILAATSQVLFTQELCQTTMRGIPGQEETARIPPRLVQGATLAATANKVSSSRIDKPPMDLAIAVEDPRAPQARTELRTEWEEVATSLVTTAFIRTASEPLRNRTSTEVVETSHCSSFNRTTSVGRMVGGQALSSEGSSRTCSGQ